MSLLNDSTDSPRDGHAPERLPKLSTVSLATSPSTENGPRVLLVHGTMDRSTSFRRTAKQLTGYEVVSYDRRGYGSSLFLDSRGVPRKVSWQIHLDDLSEIVAEKPTVIFGHSYGGSLSLLAAERKIENLLGVISFESPLSWLPNWSRWSDNAVEPSEEIDLEWSKQRVKEFMIAQIGEQNWDRLPPTTKRQRESEGITMVSEMRSMAHLSPVLDPTQIGVPTIIARSEGAADRHVMAADTLSKNIPGARLRIISCTNHGVHLQQPAKVAEMVRELIALCSEMAEGKSSKT